MLDFVEFLVQKAGQLKKVSSEASNSSISSTTQEKKQLSLQEIARLTIEERHKLLAPYIAATTEDFLNDPELTEFSILDGEDWETEIDNIIHVEETESTGSHDAFLNGYVLEDERLYDN